MRAVPKNELDTHLTTEPVEPRSCAICGMSGMNDPDVSTDNTIINKRPNDKDEMHDALGKVAVSAVIDAMTRLCEGVNLL